MESFPVLSLTTFLPLVGVLFILIVRGDDETVARNARYAALWTSVATFIVSLLLWFNFDHSTADFQFVEKFDWIPWPPRPVAVFGHRNYTRAATLGN